MGAAQVVRGLLPGVATRCSGNTATTDYGYRWHGQTMPATTTAAKGRK